MKEIERVSHRRKSKASATVAVNTDGTSRPFWACHNLWVHLTANGRNNLYPILTKWYRSDGARVVAGESICELRTTTAIIAVAADSSGVLRHLKEVGQEVRAGERVANISGEGNGSEENEKSG